MDSNNKFCEAEDRISKLPLSLVHHILSFLDDIKHVARTCVLSKRWKYIWTSIPNLIFPCYRSEPPSLPETNKFMEFVDRTLLLHDTSSSILKFALRTNEHMSASRVHSWIENLTSHNVQDLVIFFDQEKPFYIPLSLFTCQSLITLELTAGYGNMYLPKNFSFPKLKTLKLNGFQFTNDACSWNEQHFSDCPVLENLSLVKCTWLGVRNFCISSSALKFLEFGSTLEGDGLRGCVLEINAPNLVQLTYSGCVAKGYVFSSFQALKAANLYLIYQDGVPMEQNMGYSAAVNNLIRALSSVRSLEIYADTLKVLSIMNILPVFHELDMLIVGKAQTTDKLLFHLLKAVPNLRSLEFNEECTDDNLEEEHSWAGHMSTAGCLFQHLESVSFYHFRWHARQMRWLELILKNAKDLEAVELILRSDDAINQEVLISELLNVPRASDRCKFNLEEYREWGLEDFGEHSDIEEYVEWGLEDFGEHSDIEEYVEWGLEDFGF